MAMEWRKRLCSPMWIACLLVLTGAVAAAFLLRPATNRSWRIRSGGIRYYCGRLIDGVPTGDLVELKGDSGNLAGAILSSHIRASFGISGCDIRDLDESLLIRQVFEEGTTEDYFVYQIGDTANIQKGNRSMRSSFTIELYEQLADAMRGERIYFPIDYWAIFDFPERYGPAVAKQEGTLVSGRPESAETMWVLDRFLAKTRRGEPAEMLVVNYGIDSPPLIKRVVYDQTGYHVFQSVVRQPPGRGYFIGTGQYMTILKEGDSAYLYVTDKEYLPYWGDRQDGIWIAGFHAEEVSGLQ